MFTGDKVFAEIDILVADIYFDVVLGLDFIQTTGMIICHDPENTSFGHVSLLPPPDCMKTGPGEYPAPHVHPPGRLTECFVDSKKQLVAKVRLATTENEFFACGLEINQEAVIDTGSLFSVIDKQLAEWIIYFFNENIQKFEKEKTIRCTNDTSIHAYGRIPLHILFEVCVIGYDANVVAADFQSVCINVLVVENYAPGLTLGQSFLRSAGVWLHPLTGTMGSIHDKERDAPRLLTEMAILRHSDFRGPPAHSRKPEDYVLDEETKAAIVARNEFYDICPNFHKARPNWRDSILCPIPSAPSLPRDIFKPVHYVRKGTCTSSDEEKETDEPTLNMIATRNRLPNLLSTLHPDSHPVAVNDENEFPDFPESVEEYTKGFLRYYDNLIKQDHKRKSVIMTNEKVSPLQFEDKELNVSEILTWLEKYAARHSHRISQHLLFPGRATRSVLPISLRHPHIE